jgi:hypothetical protein
MLALPFFGNHFNELLILYAFAFQIPVGIHHQVKEMVVYGLQIVSLFLPFLYLNEDF